ncbi:c-type cytochrome [Halomonas alkalisoli]|uniref:c-type cytochrome n=1 Tax=Halomonas alkalisoli TaxID=2907158 RepID=UPI001F2CE1B4|nr:c-type cytochrome [Halomonas alkalisoli]MCE9681148.1 c-type cytochrome [Halomonas alkalisoli]
MKRRIVIGGGVVILGVAGLVIAWLGGFLPSSSDPDPERHRSPTGNVPATEQRRGDPVAGHHALVNEPYVSCGMPYEAWRRLAPETDPADLLPGREGHNAELPYFLTAHVNSDDVEIVSNNCLVCHAARVGDEVVVGLGDALADFTGDPRSLVNQVGRYVRGPAQTAAWQHWADRIEGIAPYIRTGTIGMNPATNLSWALMAHRDPETMAWSDTPLLEPPPERPVPLRTPPWWWMSKKNAMFYTTIGRGDHSRYMLFASLLCADTVEELREIDAYAPDMRAYLESLAPPAFPGEIDEALAAEGRPVFEENCASCHGTYGEAPSYPNRVIPLDQIGTDPLYAATMTDGSLDRFYEWVERSPHGGTVRAAPAVGYIAPPLDGIWAVAPYLHNGSVPSLAALLDSRLRPSYWRHAETREYDAEAMGWRHEVLEAGKDAADDPAERVHIYDTTLPGYDNGGHYFGDALTEQERRAVIEYLKSL